MKKKRCKSKKEKDYIQVLYKKKKDEASMFCKSFECRDY